MPDLSLSVPCYNEEAVVRGTVTALADAFAEAGVAVELVVVDNGSVDGTSEVIDRMIDDGLPVTKAVVERNVGYGFGALTGLRASRGTYVGVIPADGQVDPIDVVKLFELLAASSQPRLVKVRRRFRLDGFKRKIVSTTYNALINVLWLGVGSIDVNGSPKMFPREYLARMDLQSHDWFLDAEMLIKAKRLGLAVFEVNVFAQMRMGGSSNVNASTIGEFLRNLVRWRLSPPHGATELAGDDALPVTGDR